MPCYLNVMAKSSMQNSGAWGQKMSLPAKPTALNTYKLKRLEMTALGSIE